MRRPFQKLAFVLPHYFIIIRHENQATALWLYLCTKEKTPFLFYWKRMLRYKGKSVFMDFLHVLLRAVFSLIGKLNPLLGDRKP